MSYKATILEIDIEVFNFIHKYKLEHNGNSPTVREIVEGTATKSTSHVSSILYKLEMGGYITLLGIRQIEMVSISCDDNSDSPTPILGEEI